MDPQQMAEAVRVIRAAAPAAIIEASGGISLATARDKAQSGVDVLSIGALTHSAPSLDLALDIEIYL
jgi:nicotinate-nucleotide pyrophosphorylase (carboxylating)